MLRVRPKSTTIKGLIIFCAVIFLCLPTFASGSPDTEAVLRRFIFNEDLDALLKMIITSVVMLGLIVIIAAEKVHRTMVAMLGGGILILLTHTLGNYFELFHFITFDQAFIGETSGRPAVDYEVIGLLTGMMIIIGVLSETGVFEWLALRLFQISKGCKGKLVILFVITTAILSAFLDNVTTVILITPVALQIARIIKMSPIALMMPVILASNIGGTATLIGDPPNILIGAASGLSFNAFLQTLAFPVIVIMFIVLIQMKIVYRSEYADCTKLNVKKEVKKLEHSCRIIHPKLLKTSLTALLCVILFFFLHHTFNMSPAVPAICGAAILMYFRDRNIMKRFKSRGKTKEGVYEDSVEEIEVGILKAFEKDVEWSVLAFFAFLFVCVGALEHSGALTLVAEYIELNFAGDGTTRDLFICAIVILWVAAIASAFLDNIPFTIVMLPVVADLIGVGGPFGELAGRELLWWALALGACLGGNGTIIGASANIVTVGMMEKEGVKMSFMDFFKIGFPSMLIQVILATGVLYAYYAYLEKGIILFGVH